MTLDLVVFFEAERARVARNTGFHVFRIALQGWRRLSDEKPRGSCGNALQGAMTRAGLSRC
ncbi:hypothetical protein B1812_00265 [Methylocystis bryophila]|uniref:Uncharacterized protein n=1 Tax=Methylocystis bryophila TaxID=655015 RepID=A0A1W6MQE1_9HYPH|nr:hypothetical protein B1812_00265 [Methylocystis bryophila]